MSAFELAMTALLTAHITGHTLAAIVLYQVEGLDGRRIRKGMVFAGLVMLSISAVGGLAVTVMHDRPEFLPLILGRLGGTMLIWGALLFHWGRVERLILGSGLAWKLYCRAIMAWKGVASGQDTDR